MKPDIELHIEELVLYGFPAGQRYMIALAVEKEVARLLEENGWPAEATSSLQLSSLDAGNFTLPPAAKPEDTGIAIASSVYHLSHAEVFSK